MATVVFRPRMVRKLNDPLTVSSHATDRHVFFMLVTDLPSGVGVSTSVKPPRTRWDVYNDVKASLLDKNCTPGTFHLKNRGITIVARDLRKIEEDHYDVDFGPEHGIIDGMHTYRMIIEAQQDPEVVLPKKQFVKVEILTRVPDQWLPEIAAALNTSIVAYGNSLLPLQEAFGWIKSELVDSPYFKHISWSESERGTIDVRDLLALLTCFDTAAYANSATLHPVAAYDNRAVVLSSFTEDVKQNDGAHYRKLRPLLKDILRLHDTVQLEMPKLLERSRSPHTDLVERAAKKPYEFPFIGTRSTERLAKGALLPVVAAFRWFVENDPVTGDAKWRGGFANVMDRWRAAAERLVAQTIAKCGEVGGDPDAVGRSAAHWSALHKELAFVDMMTKTQPAAAPPAPATARDAATNHGSARPGNRSA